MKAVFKRAAPYADDAMNLPVKDVDAAVPFYENTLGFRVVSRQDEPQKRIVLARDDVQIGLSENGGDPTQEGCFKGTAPTDEDLEVQEMGRLPFRVFFVVAPDGLCYMLGERQK